MLHSRDCQSSEFVPSQAIVSNEVRRVIEITFDQTLSFVLAFTGIFTNIIIIIVFAKQGFKDSISISMTSIAVWDLLKATLGTMRRMAAPIGIWSPAYAESWSNIAMATLGYLVSFSTYVTSVLAAYVAVERCLYITIPQKTKWLLTRKISFAVCLSISVIIFGWFSVALKMYDICWFYSEKFNQTVAVYDFSDFATNNTVFFDFYTISGILWPLISLVVIIISTVIISHRLRSVSAFRGKHISIHDIPASANPGLAISPIVNDLSTSTTSRKISRRDHRVIKMLLVIVGIYIVCITPREAIYITKYFVYDFYFLREYHNSFLTMVYIELFFDVLNGTINLFVFLKMSSSFRATFLETFRCYNRLRNLCQR